jgi:hypothetical protein
MRLLGIIASALNVVVCSIPINWWYTNIGGIIKLLDSPFQISLILFGNDYTNNLLFPINLVLFGLRLYIIILNILNIYYIFKGTKVISLFIFWSFIFYLVESLLFFIISYITLGNYIIPIGSYIIENSTPSYEMSLLVENYPTFVYYLAGVAGITSLVYKIRK